MDTYDNTQAGMVLSEAALEKTIARTQHDAENAHEKHEWTEELRNSDGDVVCTYRMWKTKSCGKPECHHPLYSPSPV